MLPDAQGALDTTTPGGRLFSHVFAALAEFIRELIVRAPARAWAPPDASPAGQVSIKACLIWHAASSAYAVSGPHSETVNKRFSAGKTSRG
ncbi:hypothetical protein ACWEU6_30790 [Streptosporangium sandarakinum]|uniref:hypothetical protein n=1 Tax=Streptosporangium sandarakinum TaxID=1260955 RepID=UPI0036BD0021